VYSIQNRGDWHDGHIIIITDQRDHFQQSFRQDAINPETIHVIQAKVEHLKPMQVTNFTDPSDLPETPVSYKTATMIYKRFKTLVLDYAEEVLVVTGILPQLETILYMDVDIIAIRSVREFLQEHKHVFSNAMPNTNSSGMIEKDKVPVISSEIFMFRDCPTCAKNILNSGIILMHRQRSKHCLERWRYFFDTSPHTERDQSLLRKLKKFVPGCHLRLLQKKYVLYPNWKEMRLGNMSDPSTTFIHNSNTYGSTRIPDHIQRNYFTLLLNTSKYSKEVEHF
jgi:hypothetical protein